MKKLWISMVVVAMALASHAATITWTATETLVAATVRITADGAEDEAWNTSDTLMSAGVSNPGYKGAFWSYDSNAAGEADISMLALQNAGLTPLDTLRVVTRSTTTGDPATIQAMFGIDTTALADTDTLSALSAQRVLGGTGDDTADVRWFVEAGSSLYVSEVMGTASGTESNFSLDSTTALEWFSFDGTANILTAIGSSMGTDTLANLGWSNINAAGLYFNMANTIDSNHTGELATFSATAGGAGVEPSLSVVPGSIAMDLALTDNSTTATVDVSYVSSTNMEITISISDTNAAGFSVQGGTNQTLTTSPTALEFEFDNTVAGLGGGETATGLVTIAWSEQGGGTNGQVQVPISASVISAVVEWDGNLDLLSVDQTYNATQAVDRVWSTSSAVMPAFGGYASFKAAYSMYDDMTTLDGADYRALYKIESTIGAIDEIWVRGGGNLVSNSYATIVGFDTSSFDASLQLDAIAVEISEELGIDTTTFRWFIEAGGNAYVSAEVDELTTTYTTISLDSATAVEWFAFDDAVNIGSAIGASQGTKTLQAMGFANLAYVGVYTYATFASPAPWHGSRVKFFSATGGLGAGYVSWAAGYGLTGDDALTGTDVEPDGLDNLMEYALGGNPTNDDAAAVSPDTYMADVDGTNWFYHVYNQNTDDVSLTFEMGATPNLVTTAADTNDVEWVGATAETNGFKTVTNRTEAATAAKFIKLEVSK